MDAVQDGARLGGEPPALGVGHSRFPGQPGRHTVDEFDLQRARALGERYQHTRRAETPEKLERRGLAAVGEPALGAEHSDGRNSAPFLRFYQGAGRGPQQVSAAGPTPRDDGGEPGAISQEALLAARFKRYQMDVVRTAGRKVECLHGGTQHTMMACSGS